jgi:hypothetical protein
MLKRVRQTWIDDVLDTSLDKLVRLALGVDHWPGEILQRRMDSDATMAYPSRWMATERSVRSSTTSVASCSSSDRQGQARPPCCWN